MKISKSKQELARIISENGGWSDGANWSAQQKANGRVVFTRSKYKSEFKDGCWDGFGTFYGGFVTHKAIPNWHQCILSREEYFHLHPEQHTVESSLNDDLGIIVKSSTPALIVKGVKLTGNEVMGERKPTIEQLAAEYRNLKELADCKQAEADAAKADAEAKLAELVAAGKALGLVLSVAESEPNPEPELVITDWRDLQLGDEIEYLAGGIKKLIGKKCVVTGFDHKSTYQNVKCFYEDENLTEIGWPMKWRFIRRP